MVKPERICSVDACERPVKNVGLMLCGMHYQRLLRDGETGTAELRRHDGPDRPVCAVDGCDLPSRRNRLCELHSKRLASNGDALIVQYIRGDDDARMESYIKRLDNGCWEWTGYVWKDSGYGRTSIGSDSKRAHIVIWERENGPVPKGMALDHICHNEAVARGECAGGPSCRHRRCVNPNHLVPKSMADNQRAAKSARTHCSGGHEWTEANTQIVTRRDGTTYRQCRTCRRLRQQERRERKRSRPA